LGLCNFHRTVAPSLYFYRINFIGCMERRGSPEGGCDAVRACGIAAA